ncbi:MBL fold metallo-hydrolase [Celeribacter indicus]|uniref:Metallo-beta-lactamase-like protein n=1 Tax=Celeribacter indicus TaxID=1208324 RepID=A0A0B5E9I0_9RHOB|nr:MBL fold metallo-hydrolase [Celeribacter indicus]AJE48987.1 metallo-beta-lactamase-like protein [Celeribacter indicus]SDW43038.1 Glyoxylase, beta-lactamase superfamily II [Celeribacter indicus]
MTQPIRTFHDAPEPGGVREVAEGVFWAQMPMPKPLGHVNVYAFDEGDGWSVVDTGIDTAQTRAAWEALLAGPLAGKPVTRVIATHHHLDHIGLAGWFMTDHGASLMTTRTAYLMARMLQLDVQEAPTPEMCAFWRSCGMAPEIYQSRLSERPFNTADATAPIPLGYRRIREGDTVEIGGRLWDVRCGDGHAPEHATFWSRDGDLVIGGDQLLGAISPNLGIHSTEPFADPVGDWLESCQKFLPHATGEQLVLTGHRLPYRGLPVRLRQLIDGHEHALGRLLEALAEPRTACECFDVLFRRKIGAGEYGLAMVEAMAHCRHLEARGLVIGRLREDGAILWQAGE